MQLARVFERLLRVRGHEGQLVDYANLYSLDYDTGIAGVDTDDARALFEMGRGFLFDTARLIAGVRDGAHATAIDAFHGLTPAEKTDLVNAGAALANWFDRTYPKPSLDHRSWQPDRLEYRFAVWDAAAICAWRWTRITAAISTGTRSMSHATSHSDRSGR